VTLVLASKNEALRVTLWRASGLDLGLDTFGLVNITANKG